MLDFLKKDDDGHLDASMRTPASAAKLLAGMRAADPAVALEELAGWVEKGLPTHDAKLRSQVLSQIHEAGSGHVGALLAQFLGKPAGNSSKADPSTWETLSRYLIVLAHALYTWPGTAEGPRQQPVAPARRRGRRGEVHSGLPNAGRPASCAI